MTGQQLSKNLYIYRLPPLPVLADSLSIQLATSNPASESTKRSIGVDMFPGHVPRIWRQRTERKGFAFLCLFPERYKETVFQPTPWDHGQRYLKTHNPQETHEYQFIPDWDGCNWWVSIFVGDLDIPKRSKDSVIISVWESISHHWAFLLEFRCHPQVEATQQLVPISGS